MRFIFLTHSVVSDWNHGNAHFLRGIIRELAARGHDIVAWEPAAGWSRTHLIAEQGAIAVARFHRLFPEIAVRTYGPEPDVDEILDGAQVVVVHEWTEPSLVAEIGNRRAHGAGFTLLFHDTHHRAVSADTEIAALDLDGYDAVLAFGEVLSQLYSRRGWGRRAFTWHEAADTRLFHPHPEITRKTDLVWIGNWGDGERDAALRSFLIEPVRRLQLSAVAHGVRYPPTATQALKDAGFTCCGWLPNAEVPRVFAEHRVTVHIPRAPYTKSLPGIPTIRVFEALACGIPLVSAPWHDCEGLFRSGIDYLPARSGEEMTQQLRRVLSDTDFAETLRANGLEQIRKRHSCRHRVDELMRILFRIDTAAPLPETQKMMS